METPSPPSSRPDTDTDPAHSTFSPVHPVTPTTASPVATSSRDTLTRQDENDISLDERISALKIVERETSSARSPPDQSDLLSPINLSGPTVTPQAQVPSQTDVVPSQTIEDPEATADDQGKIYTFGREVIVSPDATIKKGDTILRCNPICRVLNDALLLTHCSACFNNQALFDFKHGLEEEGPPPAARSMLPCGRCQKVVYCSARCYSKNFEEHCLECRALGAVASKESVSAKVRLVVKVLRSGKKGFLKTHELCTLNADAASPIAPLAHFVRYFLEDFDTDRIMKFDYKRHGLRNQDELLRITRKIVAAIFPVQNPLGTNIGLCVSPDVSVFKHECASTAFISFPDGVDVDRSMYVVASENFQAGESISISYVDHGLPYHLRDRPLRESGFDHFCMTCRRSDPDPSFCAVHTNGCGRIHITRDNMPFYLNLRCDGCREQVVHPDTGSTFIAPVQSYIHQDLQGSLPSTITPPMDGGTEALLISDVLNRMAPVFPPTYWPVPYLHRRVAMLVITNPESSVPEMIAAVQHLGLALDALDEWHGYRGCPQILYIWLLKTAAHEKVRLKLERQTPKDAKAIADQERERDEAVEQARAELLALYGQRCFVGWMGRLVESWMGLS